MKICHIMSEALSQHMIILYGTQTGNAQDVAERIWRESRSSQQFSNSCISSLEHFRIERLQEDCLAIFVCSTTGQGETPTSMKLFWRRLLRKDLPNNWLEKLRFGVFGLGDSSYAQFNFVAKKLHRRLLNLGATPLLDLGLGDDQHDLGYDAAVDPWIATLWQNTDFNVDILDSLPLFRWYATIINSTHVDEEKSLYPISNHQSNMEFEVSVVSNRRITDSHHFQDVRLITVETNNGQRYQPGDVISLRPRNLNWQVVHFKKTLTDNGVHFADSDRFKLTETDPEMPIPGVLQLKEANFHQLCTEYFDLMAVPRRRTFEILAKLTSSDLEREKCEEFASAIGQQDLYSYCNRPRRTIVEVLDDFPNATRNLNASTLFEILPPIRPRDFSIASSIFNNVFANRIDILLAVVRYRTNLAQERFGLCSNHLADLKVGNKVAASLKRGSFRFPLENQQDGAVNKVIMVGPGTGVAPFRSFLQERIAAGSATHENTLLFFGCRYANRDFLCREEFEKYAAEGKLQLVTAFSREQPEKIYVQDKIVDNGRFVWKILSDQNAYVFIAGRAKNMPQDVRKAFVTVCERFGRLNPTEAENFVRNLEKSNRYQTECWS